MKATMHFANLWVHALKTAHAKQHLRTQVMQFFQQLNHW